MWDDATFLDTQATTCSTEDEIIDVEDDLQRELAFYNQVRLPAPCASVLCTQDTGTKTVSTLYAYIVDTCCRLYLECRAQSSK